MNWPSTLRKLASPVALLIVALLIASMVGQASAQQPPLAEPVSVAPTSLQVVDGFDYPVGNGWTFWHGFGYLGAVYAGSYHAGEDWCTGTNGACDGRTANQPVYAIGTGIVRYASGSYPGNVIIIEHLLPNGEIWYSMYGHVIAEVSVDQSVGRGQQIARIFDQAGNSHLHFEIRNFYMRDEVNGANSACARHRNYPPGPGYWPICGSTGTLAEKGWVNPSSFINARRTLTAPANEIVCDNQDACFSKYESGGAGSWGYVQPGTGDSSAAYNSHAYWTYSSLNSAIDWGMWQPNLPQAGTYDVYIWYPHFPGSAPETNSAHYLVHDVNGDQSVIWNQAVNYGQWNKVAAASCTVGTACYVKLTDETPESGSRRVWFDAVKFVRVEQPTPGDTTMPDGAITAPQSGQTINSDTRTLSAEAWDNPGGSGVARVEFKVFYNGAWREGGAAAASPFTVRWTPPAGLPSQQIQFAIHVIDNAGNRRIDPGGIKLVNFQASQPVDNGYKLPFPGGTSYLCTQGNNSAFSHNGQYAYAFDFGMPRNSAVTATRNGRVVAVKGNSTRGGCSSMYIADANYIRVRHIDGTDSLYVHLDSVAVRNGDYVQRGQVIGRSGQTGWSCGAHLHYDRRNAGNMTIATSFLDAAGGVPRTGGWYTSANWLGLASVQLHQGDGDVQATDQVAPLGKVQFHLSGAVSYTLWLEAEDDTSPLTDLHMRLAETEASLADAPWQPFASDLAWDLPTVWVQYRDQAGNLSSISADALDPAATSPLTATFTIEASVCANVETPIVNTTTPFCEQCQWAWELGNGTTSIKPDPEPAVFSAGTHSITLTVTGASNTSSATRQVTALPAPDAAFTITRQGNTITVTGNDADATAWEWSFGDGATANGRVATHTYTSIGTGENIPVVRVTARGTSGCTSEASATLPVYTTSIYLPVVKR